MKSLAIIALASTAYATPFFPVGKSHTSVATPPSPPVSLPYPELPSGVVPALPGKTSPKVPESSPCDTTSPYGELPTPTATVPATETVKPTHTGKPSHTIPISGTSPLSTWTKTEPADEPDCTEEPEYTEKPSVGKPAPSSTGVISVIISSSTDVSTVTKPTFKSSTKTIVASPTLTTAPEQFTGAAVATAGVAWNAALGVAGLVGFALV